MGPKGRLELTNSRGGYISYLFTFSPFFFCPTVIERHPPPTSPCSSDKWILYLVSDCVIISGHVCTCIRGQSVQTDSPQPQHNPNPPTPSHHVCFSGARATRRRHDRPASSPRRRLFPRMVLRVVQHPGTPPAPDPRLRRLPHPGEGEGHPGVRVGRRRRRRKQAAAAAPAAPAGCGWWRGPGRDERPSRRRRPRRRRVAFCVRQQEVARGARLLALAFARVCPWGGWRMMDLCASESEVFTAERCPAGSPCNAVMLWRYSRYGACRHEQVAQDENSRMRSVLYAP